ncbi:MAG: hypothetical protein ACFCGT_18765 [Sandaracinaceae bacterium]
MRLPPPLARLLPSIALAILSACGAPQLPDAEQGAIDTLEQLTGHRHLHPWRTPEVLTSGLQVDEFLGRTVVSQTDGHLELGGLAWHGPVVGIDDADRPIRLELQGEEFFELQTALERLFGLGFETGRTYRVRLNLAWHPIRLQEPQPTLEFLGDDGIYGRPFVSSLAFASRMTIETFVERTIEGGIELVPLDIAEISTRAGQSQTRDNTMEASNVIFGFRTTDGADWQSERIGQRPQLDLELLKPEPEQIIQSPRVSIQVKVRGYQELGPERGDLQIYAWIQQIGANTGTVSPIGAPVDLENGVFELLTNLGGLDDGNGERYSVVVFALFYRLYNVNERTQLPTTSYTRPARDNGHASVVVTRQDIIN